MPFTPFHLGPGACLALPLRRIIDLPVFLLSNIVIDLEPLAVMLLGLTGPLHGPLHTFLGGSMAGILWAVVAFPARGILGRLMSILRLPYDTNFRKILVSSILGVWLHILLDAPLYENIRPFYPWMNNPFYAKMGLVPMYGFCALTFVPAFVLYRNAQYAKADAKGKGEKP